MDRQGSHNQPSRGRSGRSSSSVNPHPENSSISIDFACTLIERCMQKYMTKSEVIAILSDIAKMERSYAELVWEQLERENAAFFKAYHTSLNVIDQITTLKNFISGQQLVTEHQSRQLQLLSVQHSRQQQLLSEQLSLQVQLSRQQQLLSEKLSLQDQLMTEHLNRQPVQRSPPGLTTGILSTQQPPIPSPSADHGNVSTEQMNSGNDGRMVRNANVATNSQSLELPSDMLRGFDSASTSDSERIPQSLRFGMDDEPKSSTGVVMSDPTSDGSNLPEKRRKNDE